MTAVIQAFTCGHLTIPTGFLLAGRDGTTRVPITSYLVDHPKGRLVFDTGLHLSTQTDSAAHIGEVLHAFHEFDYGDGEDIAARLEPVERSVEPSRPHVERQRRFTSTGGWDVRMRGCAAVERALPYAQSEAVPLERRGVPVCGWVERSFGQAQGMVWVVELVGSVGDHDGRGLSGGGELGEESHDLPPAGIVECCGGFVGEHDRWVAHECSGDGDALAFAAGELSGSVVEPVAEPDGVEQVAGLVAVVGGDLAVEVGDELELLDGGEGWEQVGALEDEADVVASDGRTATVGCVR